METPARVILLVEDDEAFLRTAERILLRGGYSILAASGPFAALEQSRAYEGHIEVLLTDVNMPGMDGITLAECVVTEHPNIRVLLMSAATTVESRFPLLTKPFRIGQLLEAVSKTIADPLPVPAIACAPEGSNTSRVGAALAAEVDQALHGYLESSRNLLAVTRDVPSGIPAPDGRFRIRRAAYSRKRAFEEYGRAQKKLIDRMKLEHGRGESESKE